MSYKDDNQQGNDDTDLLECSQQTEYLKVKTPNKMSDEIKNKKSEFSEKRYISKKMTDSNNKYRGPSNLSQSDSRSKSSSKSNKDKMQIPILPTQYYPIKYNLVSLH